MKLWISLFAVFCFVGIARAQAPQEYPDVPLDHPTYADVKIWFGEHETFFCSFGEPNSNPRLMTRYEFAVAVARAIGFSGIPSGKGETVTHNAIQGRNSQELAALARLVAEFKPELQQLATFENQVQLAQKELAARTGSTPSAKPPIAAPFQDVPKTYWAFDAVERLRQSGILIGNPSKSFSQ